VSSRVESSEKVDASDLNSLPSRVEGNRPSDISPLILINIYIFYGTFTRSVFSKTPVQLNIYINSSAKLRCY
jgi:hypothetical protein